VVQPANHVWFSRSGSPFSKIGERVMRQNTAKSIFNFFMWESPRLLWVLLSETEIVFLKRKDYDTDHANEHSDGCKSS
jgi:hypothetical protein